MSKSATGTNIPPPPKKSRMDPPVIPEKPSGLFDDKTGADPEPIENKEQEEGAGSPPEDTDKDEEPKKKETSLLTHKTSFDLPMPAFLELNDKINKQYASDPSKQRLTISALILQALHEAGYTIPEEFLADRRGSHLKKS